jgi:ATP-dependent DNA helicase
MTTSPQRQIDQEFEQVLMDQKRARLSNLLTQTTLYSKYLAEQAINSSSQKQQTISQPSLMTGVTLKAYQCEGLSWLVSLYENGLNGILADEMGLGKTIQTIAFLSFLWERGIKGPFLIVGPVSTLSNWMNELKKCTPSIPCVMYHGAIDERATIRSRHFLGKSQELIVVTSYEIVMKDKKYLSKFNFKYLVVDEGHRLKNLDCKLIRMLKNDYSFDNRLLLTGTPLQNNLTELWSLLNFLLPDIFDDLDTFHQWFSDLEESQTEALEASLGIVHTLHTILKPFLLRRLKCDVELAIPSKREFLIKAIMTAEQRRMYQKILAKERLLEAPDVAAVTQKSFMNIVMQLRKVCNHPYLIQFPLNQDGEPLIDESLVNCCGKMMILDQLVQQLLEKKHKILIFSQMTRMLDILEEYCSLPSKSIPYFRIDGSVSQAERAEQIESFNSSSSGPALFLLSTRAAGLGINLTAADKVIIYDSDWNPQADLQAQDRCHRIGQTKPVTVYRLLTKNSVEVRIVQRANEKRNLEKIVIHRNKFKGRVGQELLQDDLEMLLQQRNFTNLEHENDASQEEKNTNILTEQELRTLMGRDGEFVQESEHVSTQTLIPEANQL